MCYFCQCPWYVLDTVVRSAEDVIKHWLISRDWQVPVHDNAVFVFSCVSCCPPVAHPLSQHHLSCDLMLLSASTFHTLQLYPVHHHFRWRRAPVTQWAGRDWDKQPPYPPTCLACFHFLREIFIPSQEDLTSLLPTSLLWLPASCLIIEVV